MKVWMCFLVDYKNKLPYFKCINIEKEKWIQHKEYTKISYVVGRIWDIVEVWNDKKLTIKLGPQD